MNLKSSFYVNSGKVSLFLFDFALKRMVKILFITSGLAVGGAETMLFKILSHIDRGRFEPQVIILASADFIAQRIRALGIPVFCLKFDRFFFPLSPLFGLLLLIIFIRPNVVQTWMYHADLIGGIAARLLGISRVVWGIRNSSLVRDSTCFSTRLIVRLCAAVSFFIPNAILSCSSRAIECHQEIGYCAEKLRFIPNGFDVKLFFPDGEARNWLCDELRLSKESFFVGLIARFDPQKNHAGFIAAAASIREAVPHARFIFAGAGIDYENTALKSLIERFELSDFTYLLGCRTDIHRVIGALDVLVSSSSYGEAFPNVLGEAMACEVPCVVTDVGDSAEIVGETGRVVAVGDMRQLAREVIEILGLPLEERKRLGRLARLRVMEHYDIKAVTRVYEDFYEEILRGGA